MKTRILSYFLTGFIYSFFMGCQNGQTSLISSNIIRPFNGRDLSGWKFTQDAKYSKWVVGTAEVDSKDPAKLIAKPGTGQMINMGAHYDDSINIYTAEKFGDCRIELEAMIPKGSNSGIYISGEYEIQILDTFGKEKPGPGDMGGVVGVAAPTARADKTPGPGDMGGVVGVAAPKVSADNPPGQWQKFVIEYRAPRFDAAGNKVKNARLFKVILNEKTIHENLELPGFTPSGLNEKEAPTGPLLLQGNHGFAAFRNIQITPLPESR
jgi:hypothetical protein